jgi:soluble lytic murein transglycosylase
MEVMIDLHNITQSDRHRADRDLRGRLSSRHIHFFAGLFAASVMTSPALAEDQVSPSGGYAASTPYRATDPVSSALSQWSALRQTETLPFSSYSTFMIAHPGWPGEAAMRKVAERALKPEIDAPGNVITFFRKFPPQSASAALRFAEALARTGAGDEAKSVARSAWLAGPLTTDDESRFLIRFGSVPTANDQDDRMERLLWGRSTTAATRQLMQTSPANRGLFDTRLAMLTRAPDAAAKVGMTDARGRSDPGYIIDRASWMRGTSQIQGVRSYLSGSRTLSKLPLDPETWFETLYVNAKDAANDGQWLVAYNIARQVDDAYSPDTVVRDRSFGERDAYTNLTWLAGSAALNKLGRPADAIGLFERYANAAKSGQTQAKGLYWAGRAAQAAGRATDATAYYERAARFYDQFHGQLASERLGRAVKPPIMVSVPLEISAEARSAFNQREIVRAATQLGQLGNWTDQTQFVRTIASQAKSDVDHMLAVELAQRINRPDLGVLVGRNAYVNGLAEFVKSGFPQISVPNDYLGSWTMIHAISRQESNFDRQAVSRVGARGLMQLMPGTARETAPRAGLSYNPASLTDPSYNVSLGSTYFGQLMTQYGGNYVLSVAAYNAGPGNVNKWLRANGDPRNGVDVISWIESIPLSETRSYVQRVLENAVVYDLLNPARANVKGRNPLSTYLGKSQPG